MIGENVWSARDGCAAEAAYLFAEHPSRREALNLGMFSSKTVEELTTFGLRRLGEGLFHVATGVTFGGVAVPWGKFTVTVWSDHYMTVVVPPGAKSGPVTVQETTGNLSTLYNFTITCSSRLCLDLP